MNKYIVCALCKKKIGINGLASHLINKHDRKYNSFSYYVKFIKKNGEGLCLHCGKQTKFISLSKGFTKYCSISCANKSEEHKANCIKGNLAKYGVPYANQSKFVRNKTEKTNLKRYGYKSPAQNKEVLNKMQKTCLDRYGHKVPIQNEEIKNKIRNTLLSNYGYIYAMQSDVVKEKSKETCIKKYGHEYSLQSKEIQEKGKLTKLKKYGNENYNNKEKGKLTKLKKYGNENYNNKEKGKETRIKRLGVPYAMQSDVVKEKSKETRIKRLGVPYATQSDNVKEKSKETCLKRLGVPYAMQSDIIKDKVKKIMLKRYGYENASQNPTIHKKIFSNRRKEHHDYLSNSEYEFSKKLKKNKYKFKNEYFYNDKNWDFALFKKGKLNTLVEIDGEYFHSIFSDCDGKHSNGIKDHLRFSYLKNTKVKLVVIDSLKLDEGIKEVNKVYSLSYTKYIKRMIKQVSKLELGYNFSKERMDKDYDKLCTYKYNPRQSLGVSIVRQFTDFNVKDLDIPKLIKEHTMYYSKCSSHNPLDFIKVTNPSKIRNKYLYDDRKVIKFKKYNIGVELGILSLGKSYRGII